MEPEFQGGCLCGAVRYAARGTPVNVRVCHCRLCQKSLGAAFNARVLMRLDGVVIRGAVGEHHSSPDLVRGFCRQCGASVFSRRQAAGVIGLTCGSLDQPELFRPTEHIWTASRQAWVRLDDGLPQYAGAAPA